MSHCIVVKWYSATLEQTSEHYLRKPTTGRQETTTQMPRTEDNQESFPENLPILKWVSWGRGQGAKVIASYLTWKSVQPRDRQTIHQNTQNNRIVMVSRYFHFISIKQVQCQAPKMIQQKCTFHCLFLRIKTFLLFSSFSHHMAADVGVTVVAPYHVWTLWVVNG